jgi:undecaprenyl-diphosphatase
VAGFFSFPSGHAMMSMIGYGMLTYFVLIRVQNRWARFAIVIAAAILIFLIGFSRIYLGVHFFSDVVAGFAAGGLWLITCIGALEFLRNRQGKSKLA